MNRDETRKAIEVMQAWVDGRPVEWCPRNCPGDWRADPQHTDIDGPAWDWLQHNYRIKPEPREFWVHVDGDAFNGTVNSHDPRCDGCIRVREVIE